ncbi:50S ribosomal protein L6 [Candidatus Gribaldobacteria bacterium]|nr:50S ribosomal protein L6 [Candidatus Gribaldobacteria bacterium]
MSRIGKKPIIIPENVQVDILDNLVKVQGPKGKNEVRLLSEIKVGQEKNTLLIEKIRETKQANAFWGLTRALLNNAVLGSSHGFEKKLEIRGVGFKAVLESKNKLKLDLGFSHDVFVEIPDDIEVKVEKEIITILGCSKQKVGQFAAELRALKKPEPYKGKGIRYVGEKVRKKEGKKATATK